MSITKNKIIDFILPCQAPLCGVQRPPGAGASCFMGKKQENNAIKRVLGHSRAAKPNELNLCI